MQLEEVHRLPADEAVLALHTDKDSGLDEREALRRLKQYGPNELPKPRARSLLSVFLRQFRDFMVLVLLGATAISFLLGETGDALAILLIVTVNSLLGAIQEFRAERSLAALRELSAPYARVRRGGEEMRIPAAHVVPGDLLLLEAGDRPAADVRLLQSWQLAAEESALTGESVPVQKSAEWLAPPRAPLAERRNMVFAGTTMARGRGVGIVASTGTRTAMGGIAQLLSEQGVETTPLQERLEQLGRVLVYGCLLISAVVVVAGVLRGESPFAMFLAGVSLAVAAIPEGLPAIVTIALAIGVQRMLSRHALVRRLPAVETLGSATCICCDKTGTLTRNEMTVRAIETPDGTYRVQGEGYSVHGAIETPDGRTAHGGDLREILTAFLLCHNASLRQRGRRTLIEGDPLEAALIVVARKFGLKEQEVSRREPRLQELPFSSELRRMTTWVGHGASVRQITKGAPEVVLGLCSHELQDGRSVPLTAARRQYWLRRTAALGAESLRALAIASGRAHGLTEAQGLVFLGIVGLLDPPRSEVGRAIAQCRGAGIRTIMVTGDHPDTAAAIARHLGILQPGDQMAAGAELEDISDERLQELSRATTVYARVSPEFKLRLVEALRESGEVVAMTGDGLNDAPALNAADIGVAMGISGCDVTKEAADMVLSDDNFATIVAAVEEGRGIYDNIRRVVRYLLTCNVGEVLVMLLAALAGLPLPLLPIQILWVNLATDGLPALALGLEPVDREALQRRPRPRAEGIFAQRLGWRITTRGTLIGLGTLGIFIGARVIGVSLAEARTLSFATLVMSQLFHAFDCRSETRSLLEIGILSNPYLVGALLSSIGLLLFAVYVPFATRTFETVPLGAADWLAVLAVSGLGSLFIVVRRRFLRMRLRAARA